MSSESPSRRTTDRSGLTGERRRRGGFAEADLPLPGERPRRVHAASSVRTRDVTREAAVLAVFVAAESMGRGVADCDELESVFIGDAIEAVAEVAEYAATPACGPVVVVFGPRAVASASCGDDIEAIRRADPQALVIAGVDRGEVDPGMFDAIVRADASPAMMRRVIMGLAASSEQAATTGPIKADVGDPHPHSNTDIDIDTDTDFDHDHTPIVTTVSPARRERPKKTARPSPSASSGRDTAPTPGDGDLVDMVLAGADVLDVALDLIRARIGRDDVRYITPLGSGAHETAPDAQHAQEPAAGAVTAWVQTPASGTGRLVIDGAAGLPADQHEALTTALSVHAAWLAGWQRLGDQNRSLRRAAFTDPLTGAWNRRYCDKFLVGSIARARRERQALTVLYFDIDEFKQYNDQFGHGAGDEILVEVVKALQSVIRPSDRVCRVGGDEFVVIFDEPAGPRRADSRPPESVYVLTKRVQQKIRERAFPKLGREAAGKLTISGGLATYPWDGTDAVSLLRRADELALQSKRQGKNAITLGPGAERVCEKDVRAEAPDVW